jgi:hypothetical protein
VAIGHLAGTTSQHANSIVINASGAAFNSGVTGGFFVNPIRQAATGYLPGILTYLPLTGEIVYQP